MNTVEHVTTEGRAGAAGEQSKRIRALSELRRRQSDSLANAGL